MSKSSSKESNTSKNIPTFFDDDENIVRSLYSPFQELC